MNDNFNNVQDIDKKAEPAADPCPLVKEGDDSVVDETEKETPVAGESASQSDGEEKEAPVAEESVPQDDGEEKEAPVAEESVSQNDDEKKEAPVEEETAPKPKELTREERFQLELEELARKHIEVVARNAEQAKDPSLYDTYQATQAGLDENIKIFSARRQGRSHISGQIPCQDYCLTADTDKGVILTAADGVGSCDRSDVGSRLACEVTVAFIRELDRQCEIEEQLVTRLCSLRFRELLVKRWLQAALSHAKENPDETVAPNKMYELYGSTLLFAVITENYYVVGNLGDGQILLYNEFEGLKLRLHAPKESTKVRALVNSNCYREDFQVKQYSRKDFSGILLTTDGMYDVLCNGNMLYQYARQIESRFLEAGQPLQPFCFVEGEEPIKDLFSHRTKDDCSIVLAVDTAFAQDGLGSRIAMVGEGMDYIMPYGQEGDVFCYLMEKNKDLLYGVVTEEEQAITDLSALPVMEGIRLVMPLSSYTADGYRCTIYPDTGDHTLEELYHFGALREQTERTPNASREALKVYSALLRCKRTLQENGYCLTAAAPILMRYCVSGEILLPAQAIKPIEQEQSDDLALIDRYFDSLAGKLVSDDGEYPVFRLGYFSMGQRMFLSERPHDPMYRVTKDAQGAVLLLNQGNLPWITSDGTVAPKEKLPIKDGLTFSVSVSQGVTLTYRYVSKEEM